MNRKNPLSWARMGYDWVLTCSTRPYATFALCAVSFLESIIFPLPPDIFLLVMGGNAPRKALYFAFLAALFSVLGAVCGYLLGLGAWGFLQDFFLTWVISPEFFDTVKGLYQENTFWTVFAGAFTPIPFKIFTVLGGVFGVPFSPFLLACISGRFLRFMCIGTLLYFYGSRGRTLVEKHFNLFTIIFVIILFLGFWGIA